VLTSGSGFWGSGCHANLVGIRDIERVVSGATRAL
jgi:hypothetical protein